MISSYMLLDHKAYLCHVCHAWLSQVEPTDFYHALRPSKTKFPADFKSTKAYKCT